MIIEQLQMIITGANMKRVVIGILAHVDAGKTTLAEQILYKTGTIKNTGRVDHKNTFLDTDQMEQERGITIFSKQAVFTFQDTKITLLDTPGHVDFSAEMERTLSVLDYAILIISGSSGVQAHTVTLWKLLNTYQIPTIIFVNKMDLNPEKESVLMQDISGRLKGQFLSFHNKDQEFYEHCALMDDQIFQEYLNQGSLSEEQLAYLISKRSIYPVFFGSALKGDGVDFFLNELGQFIRMPEYGSRFLAKVFKVTRDDAEQRLTHMKITGGILKPKTLMSYTIEDTIKQEKCDQLRIYSGDSYQRAESVRPGEICAVTGLLESYPGLNYGEKTSTQKVQLEPVKSYQLLFPEEKDLILVMNALKKMEEEDPLLQILWDGQKQQIHARFLGKVQMEIFQHQVKTRFGYEVIIQDEHIVYKETILEPVIGIGHYEPLGHYAEVHLLLEPMKSGTGLVIESQVSSDDLALSYQSNILSCLKEIFIPGVLTGGPITDVKITLVGGLAHKKHTEGGDFRQATIRALRQGLRKGKVQILEPFYSIQMEVNAEHLGKIIFDLNQMGGKLEQPQIENEKAMLRGTVPVSNFGDYQIELISYTKGTGILDLVLEGYQPCENQQEVIQSIAYNCEGDLQFPTGSIFCNHGAGFYVPWEQVQEYQHLKELSLPKNLKLTLEQTYFSNQQVEEERLSKEIGSKNKDYFQEDKELEAIFERTFGPRKDRKEEQNTFHKIKDPKDMVTNPLKAQKEESTVKKPDYLLVDGYNIIFAWEELNSLAKENLDAARMKLMDIMSNYQGFRKNHVILVFDAYRVKGNPGKVETYHNIQVVYTKEAETADSYIEKTTQTMTKDAMVTVATSDYLEQLIILGQGALRMSARELLVEVNLTNRQIKETIELKTESGKIYLKEKMDI